MLLNCSVEEDSWKSLGLQGDQTSQSERKSVLNSHWKDWCWSWSSKTLATWFKELTSWKDSDAEKDWRQKGMTKDEMVGWHHRLDGHEFEQAPGVGDGQRSLACCSPWDHKESDTIEWLNRTDGTFCANVHEYIWIKFWLDAPCQTQPWNLQATGLGNVVILSSPVFSTSQRNPSKSKGHPT